MSYLIELQDIKKTYQLGDNQVQALRGVSFTLESGDFVAIVGESGSGKSTLVDIVGLLFQPTSGTYKLEGKDVTTYNENDLSRVRGQKIGFIFQSYFLLPRLTALQNVAMPLLYQNASYEQAYEKAQALLEKLHVGNLAKHRPSQMSGGQQQRVAVARALVNQPSLLLADEPTGALDYKTSNELLDIFNTLNNEGTSILMITHDVELSQRCRRRMRIRDGVIHEA